MVRYRLILSIAVLLTTILSWAGGDETTPASTLVQPAPLKSRLANAAEVRKQLGVSPDYDGLQNVDQLKIAVLDYGFDGVDQSGSYLPKNCILVENYDPDFVRRFDLGDPDYRKSFAPMNAHGRAMAQIIWAITGFHPEGPQFYLLNANGPTMLRRAVRYAFEAKVDIILFCETFEGGGNGDGRGPVNRIVNDALAAGIIWINAAGNYGGRVYNGPVRIDPDGYLRFKDGADGTALHFRNRLDGNTVTITLTWNDYRDVEDAGTDKDLDLFVEDWQGRLVGASTLRQVAADSPLGKNESRNPRERIILTDLAANPDFNYRIRIKAKSNNFTAQDQIRVLVTAAKETYVNPASRTPDDAVKFFEASKYGEIYPPADNPLVLTVGDASEQSSIGPTADHRVKPDVILQDSQAFFSDGEVNEGASNAAAYFAGIVALLKAAEPALNSRHLLRIAQEHVTQLVTSADRSSPQRSVTGYSAYGQRGSAYSRSSPSRPSTSTRRDTSSASAGSRGSNPREMLAMPAEAKDWANHWTTAAAASRESLVKKRLWQTPTRQHLADVVHAAH